MKPYPTELIAHYSALFFDLDGTLVDSMPSHNRAWQLAMQKYDIAITDEELNRLAGTPNLPTAELFVKKFSLDVDPALIVNDKETYFEESLPNLQKIQTVAEIAHKYYQQLPMGVVSGSNRNRIDQSLLVTNMEHLFSCIVSCDDTERGKPHPDPYELGAKLLNIAPERCLVFEDGEAGIQSALSAQMDIVYVKGGELFLWES